MTFALSLAIGLLTGLRSMTAPAVTAWAVNLGWLRLDGLLTHLGSGVSVAVFTFLAVSEMVIDKLPRTPSRTASLGLAARFVFGGLSGSCVASAAGLAITPGAVLGALGGILGAFGGYQARIRLVKALGTRDLVVALAEDFVAIAGCLSVVSNV